MKTSTFILIFSGLTGLNRCSSEIKYDFPFFQEKNEIKTEKVIETNDFLNFAKKEKSDSLTSNLFIPNYNHFIFEENDHKIFYLKHYI